jgi:hypothetical protein
MKGLGRQDEPLAKFLSTQKILSTDYADYTDSLLELLRSHFSSNFFSKEVCVIGESVDDRFSFVRDLSGTGEFCKRLRMTRFTGFL